MKDGESYVRASALKFIAITVRINNLWNKELSSLDLFVRYFIIHRINFYFYFCFYYFRINLLNYSVKKVKLL